MTKVSIIIPLHNSEAFIAETMQSCLEQTYENIEVIVVENGSKDKSWNIIQNFDDVRLKSYKIEASSATVARNYGYKKSTGNYIMFLDADDILSLDKIKNQMALFYKFGDQVLITCPWGKFTNNITLAEFKPQKIWNDYTPIDWLLDSWLGGGMMQTACWLVPRKLIEKTGLWDESLTSNPNDDGEFFSRVILNAKQIFFCSSAKVYYRSEIHNSLSTQISRAAIVSLLQTFINYEDNILRVEESKRVKLALAHNYLNFIYRFHPYYPDLIEKANAKIKNLNVYPLPLVGGNSFKKLARFIGFNNALWLRALLRIIRTS